MERDESEDEEVMQEMIRIRANEVRFHEHFLEYKIQKPKKSPFKKNR